MISTRRFLVLTAVTTLLAGCGGGSSDSGVSVHRPNTTYNPGVTGSGFQYTTCRVRSVRMTDASTIVIFTKPSGVSPCVLNSLTAPAPYKEQVFGFMAPWKIDKLKYSGTTVTQYSNG